MILINYDLKDYWHSYYIKNNIYDTVNIMQIMYCKIISRLSIIIRFD